jgi:hypothetical protein
MAAWGADDLQGPLTELGVDTDFWSRNRLLNEFNTLGAQGVHRRFWPGRESGCQLDGDWEQEFVNPELPEPPLRLLRAIDLADLSSLDRFVVVPVCVADALCREERNSEALTLYGAALEHAPNPWIQSELGYLFLERAEVEPLPLCAADLDKAEVIGKPGESIPFPDRSAMLDLALQAFGRAWSYTYTPVYVLEDEPDLAFEVFTLDGLRVTLQELRHRQGLVAVSDVFEGFIEFDPSGIGEYVSRLGVWRNFNEARRELLREPPPDAPELHVEKCARQFGSYWEALTERARLLVYEAEDEFSRLTAQTLRDWGGLTNKYCRALESILRQRLGATIDAEGAPLTDLLRSVLRRVKGERPRWWGFKGLDFVQFSRLLGAIPEDQDALSEFRPFLERNAPGKEDFYLRELPEKLRELAQEYRKPSSHDDPTRLVSRRELVRLRGLLLPNLADGHPGLLAQLAVFGQRVSHAGQG